MLKKTVICMICLLILIASCSGSDSVSDKNSETDDSPQNDSKSENETERKGDTNNDSDTNNEEDTDMDSGDSGESPKPLLVEHYYVESSEDIPNPERGWYRYRNYNSLGNLNSLRDNNQTLIYGRTYIPQYRNSPLSDEFLRDFTRMFESARNAGIKVNPRIIYAGNEEEEDAPLEIVLAHLDQLKPVFEENEDVINVLSGGFIGAWGEWHASSNNLATVENRTAIIDAILEALPPSRMFLMRYPPYKRDYTNGQIAEPGTWLLPQQAFNETPIARIGHLNDCFMSSATDVGTYHANGREAELEYLGAEGPFVAWGGETCRESEFNSCEHSLNDAEILHINFLNADYNNVVHDVWREEGCYEEISLKLGYRFVIKSARFAQSIKPGGVLELEVSIENVGFGNLYNPRNVEIVLINNESNKEYVAVISVDPRFWTAGRQTEFSRRISIPVDIEEGVYSMGLRLPDKSESIKDDFRYAIAFANVDVWDSNTLVNYLTQELTISDEAIGVVSNSYVSFEELN